MQVEDNKAKRLLKLNEEAGEIVQGVSKVMLFGEVGDYKGQEVQHLAQLESEIGDFLANLEFAIAAGDLNGVNILKRMAVKIQQLKTDPGLQDSHGAVELTTSFI